MNDIRGLNDSINAINSSLVLGDSIRTLSAALTNLPDLGGIINSMTGFKEFLSKDLMLGAIQSRVSRANLSISMQPNPAILESYMVEMNSSVAQIKAIDFQNITDSIREFNSSLGSIGCIGGVIGMVAAINTSLVILPDEVSAVFDLWDDIKPQIDNITSQQDSLQSGVDAITDLNGTLDSLPDFDAIIAQIRAMNDSSGMVIVQNATSTPRLTILFKGQCRISRKFIMISGSSTTQWLTYQVRNSLISYLSELNIIFDRHGRIHLQCTRVELVTSVRLPRYHTRVSGPNGIPDGRYARSSASS
jgi:hypothetical protein